MFTRSRCPACRQVIPLSHLFSTSYANWLGFRCENCHCLLKVVFDFAFCAKIAACLVLFGALDEGYKNHPSYNEIVVFMLIAAPFLVWQKLTQKLKVVEE